MENKIKFGNLGKIWIFWKYRKKLGKNWKFGKQFETQKNIRTLEKNIRNLKKKIGNLRKKIGRKFGNLENVKLEMDSWIIHLA